MTREQEKSLRRIAEKARLLAADLDGVRRNLPRLGGPLLALSADDLDRAALRIIQHMQGNDGQHPA